MCASWHEDALRACSVQVLCDTLRQFPISLGSSLRRPCECRRCERDVEPSAVCYVPYFSDCSAIDVCYVFCGVLLAGGGSTLTPSWDSVPLGLYSTWESIATTLSMCCGWEMWIPCFLYCMVQFGYLSMRPSTLKLYLACSTWYRAFIIAQLVSTGKTSSLLISMSMGSLLSRFVKRDVSKRSCMYPCFWGGCGVLCCICSLLLVGRTGSF